MKGGYALRKVFSYLGLTQAIIDSLISCGEMNIDNITFSATTDLLSTLIRSHIKEDESHETCPYCITWDREALLPPDSALNEKIMNGAFIKKIINKESIINDKLSNLLKYMAWEDSKLTCAIVAQLFERSTPYQEGLDILKELLEMKDSLKYMRFKLIFSPSLKGKDSCGVFSVVYHKTQKNEDFSIKEYLNFILTWINEDDKAQGDLLRERKPDLLFMEEIGFKHVEKIHGREKAQKLFFTNEVNFGVPRRIAAERHEVSSDSEPLEIKDDEYCALLMEFKTRLTNHYIMNTEEEKMGKAQSPESQKLVDDNAKLKELCTFLALQNEKGEANVHLNEEMGEIIGQTIEKVMKPPSKKPKKEAQESPVTTASHPNKLTKSDTGASSTTAFKESFSKDKEEIIKNTMSATQQEREVVIKALIQYNWDPNAAAGVLFR